MGVDFTAAPENEWPHLMRDLFEFEQSFACIQDAIGCVLEFPFSIELCENPKICQPVILLTLDLRAWVCELR